mgnify:CR=1 FL=1
MVHKSIWAARQDRPQETFTPDISSGIFHELQGLAGVSFSATDTEFLQNVTSHWLDAVIAGNVSKAETCNSLMLAFCQKFDGGYHG